MRTKKFGIRSLTWGNDGMKMNGERIILRGACIHHDNGLLGAACHPDALERRLRILKENGYNAIRSAHNPCSKAALEICDRMGMLVMSTSTTGISTRPSMTMWNSSTGSGSRT